MEQYHIVNKLIAADDLYWDKDEGKYIALSSDELNNLIKGCYDKGFVHVEQIMCVVNWATNARVGSILLNNLLAGNIVISGFGSDGEPIFDSHTE